jgi:CubicO group peptidase (beta-lactamase class C family)
VSTQTGNFSKVRSKVVALVEEGEIPSMAVAVAREGEILWEEAFGWADKDDEVKASPNTIYPIASLSKSLTATGIMVLVEQKKVGLDESVEEYIAPSRLTVYEGNASEVTVRRILNMTGGVPHGYIVCEDSHAAPTAQEFINRYGIVVFPPGEIALYSNFSYAVLELIAENVSGKSFGDFMKTEVFSPLGMTHTTVGVPDSLERVATKYASDETTYAHDFFVPAAAGGIYSGAHDLIKFGSFNLKNRLPDQRQILRDQTLTAMHTAESMALGWGSVALDNGTLWTLSNGGIGGATSMLSLVPSANLAVVSLTNVTSRSRITDQIAIEITDALIPKFAKRVEAFMKRYESENAFKSYTPIPRLTGSWEGKIKTPETETPIRMIFHDNGKVHVRLGKQQEAILDNVSIRNDELKADFRAESQSEDGINNEQAISIHVKVKDKRMYGVATADLDASKGLLSPSYICLNRT